MKTKLKTQPPNNQARARQFTTVQEQIIEAVSDLLIHGGHPDSTHDLIASAAHHIARREWTHLYRHSPDTDKQEKAIALRASRLEPEFHEELRLAIHLNKRTPEKSRPTAATASDRIRACIRDRVEERFQGFLANGSPEELWIMDDILSTFESFERGPGDEIPLAMGFEYAMGRGNTFLKVPYFMADKMKKYLEALRAVEDRDED